MKEVIEILKFCKTVYEDENIIAKIDDAVDVLEENGGNKSSEVVEILKSVKVAYDDKNILSQIDEAIKILGD
jgi:hypothetical protein